MVKQKPLINHEKSGERNEESKIALKIVTVSLFIKTRPKFFTMKEIN